MSYFFRHKIGEGPKHQYKELQMIVCFVKYLWKKEICGFYYCNKNYKTGNYLYLNKSNDKRSKCSVEDKDWDGLTDEAIEKMLVWRRSLS